MNLSVAEDGKVYLVERLGGIKVWNPGSTAMHTITTLPVFKGAENGLLGVALDPHFSSNHWIYLFYSPVEPEENRVSRFTLDGEILDLNSEKPLIRFHTDRKVLNHFGGDLCFDRHGNLFASTGDNTFITENDSFAPIDERPGRQSWDAQRTSANTMDLRGKILRIHPEPDGTFTIPSGNLFPYAGSNGRPEIYVMGVRNPFRFTVDSQNDWIYWGDIGPDAWTGNTNRGPAGHDEFNQARQAGNFGWPQFVADNKPYRRYNFDTHEIGEFFDPKRPVNSSPNNTGARELPPAQPAFIWYPYSPTTHFPDMGSGARAAMAGPVYHFDAGLKSGIKLPRELDGALFVFDWERMWIKLARFDAQGNLQKLESFLPEMKFKRPICMKLGPDGALYVIEWGSNWYNNTDAQLVRVEYREKNRNE
jgi:cytochrome c